MIFPEGTSISERRLRPLKTGAARIALGAEARHGFKLGLQVVPVAINYFDPSRFRSDVLLNVAPPIRVATYAAAYARDPDEAADQLTEAIRVALASCDSTLRMVDSNVAVRLGSVFFVADSLASASSWWMPVMLRSRIAPSSWLAFNAMVQHSCNASSTRPPTSARRTRNGPDSVDCTARSKRSFACCADWT